MPANSTEEYHRHHVNHAKMQLLEKGDFYHQITFAKNGREQMIVLIPTGPTRATQAAAEAIANSDESEVMSAAIVVWAKGFPKPEGYKVGDVGNSPDKTELLIVVTADRDGNRFTSVNEIFREGDKVRLEERRIELPAGMIVPELKPRKYVS
jgi:hypothetical protein